MIYIIDHEDSFTFNLAHLLGAYDTVQVSNFYEINKSQLKKKILGICLGFQQILFAEGGQIVQQKNIYHGYQSTINVLPKSYLYKHYKKLSVGRYHSLKLKEPFQSSSIDITMRCQKTNVAMALEDKKNKIFGFQFHPDSFLTKNGKSIIQKIVSA